MQRPPWINAALSRVFPLRAAVCSPSGSLLLSNPSKCMSAVRAARNVNVARMLELRDSFHYRAQPTLDIMLKKYYSEETPAWIELKLDTPVYCAYVMRVNNAYLIEIWLGYTSHLKPFHNSW